MKKFIAILIGLLVGVASSFAVTFTTFFDRPAVFVAPRESFNVNNISVTNKSKSIKLVFLDDALKGNFNAFLVLDSYTDENTYEVTKDLKRVYLFVRGELETGLGIMGKSGILDAHFSEGYVYIIGE